MEQIRKVQGKHKIFGDQKFSKTNQLKFQRQSVQNLIDKQTKVRQNETLPLDIQKKQINSELNSKYEIYKYGSPNEYEQDYQNMKVKNIYNEIKTIQSPDIIFKIAEIIQQGNQTNSLNKRNFVKYPYKTKRQFHYKNLTSEKQQMNDFCQWFKKKMLETQNIQDNAHLLFEKRQNIMACAFNQIIQQISKISKDRSKLLKMIWNSFVSQIEILLEKICIKSKQQQEEYIRSLRESHRSYQNEINYLTQQKFKVKQQMQDIKLINNKLTYNFRSERKIRIKNQILVKQLKNIVDNTKDQCLQLLEENTKLLMNIKDINKDQAKTIVYRKMQSCKQMKFLKVNTIHQIKEVIKNSTDNQLAVQSPQLQIKKQNLFDYILERFKEHPEQQQYICQDYFEDEINIEDYLKNIIETEQVSKSLKFENIQFQKEYKDAESNTVEIIKQQKHVEVSVNLYQQNQQQIENKNIYLTESSSNMCYQQKIKLKTIQDDNQEGFENFYHQKKIQEKQIVLRNSLVLLEMQKTIDFAKLRNKYSEDYLQNTITKQQKKQDQFKHKQNFTINTSLSQTDILNPQQLNKTKKNKIPSKQKLIKRQTTAIRIDQNEFLDLNSKLDDNNDITINEHINLRQIELKDIVSKYIKSNNLEISSQKPDQNIYKIISKLYKGALKFSKQLPSFYIILEEVFKNSYGNIKGNQITSQKLIKFIQQLYKYQKHNDIFKVTSLFLGINKKYQQYNHIITSNQVNLYFRLYQAFSIKNPKQNQYNILNGYSSIRKLNGESQNALSEYFNRNKIKYILQKIYEIIGYNQSNKEMYNEDSFIFKLDGICLFILEFFIITKKSYHESYASFLSFVLKQQTFQLMDKKTLEFLFFCFNLSTVNYKNSYKFFQKNMNIIHRNNKYGSIQKFYQFCILEQLPLFEQLQLKIRKLSLNLDESIQKTYLNQISYDMWLREKSNLLLIIKNKTNKHFYERSIQIIENYLKSPDPKQKHSFQYLYRILMVWIFKS